MNALSFVFICIFNQYFCVHLLDHSCIHFTMQRFFKKIGPLFNTNYSGGHETHIQV